LAVTIAAGQRQSGNDVVARLLPDGDPHRIVEVDPAKKSAVVKDLQSAQKTAKETRAVEVAFLLAVYGANYEKNRDYLVDNLRGCTNSAIKSGCDGNVADFLIVLYERGHKDVLKPLMLVGKDSYSPVVGETLGSFISNLIADGPTDFFDTIRGLSPETQKELCDFAGMADGGGLSADRLHQIQKELNARGDAISLNCLQAIEAANRR
jgi:hypothetical protein